MPRKEGMAWYSSLVDPCLLSDFVYILLCTKQGYNAVYPMTPEAREMTHHGGLPGWLEESDPAG
jgi:hypothetical protein